MVGDCLGIFRQRVLKENWQFCFNILTTLVKTLTTAKTTALSATCSAPCSAKNRREKVREILLVVASPAASSRTGWLPARRRTKLLLRATVLTYLVILRTLYAVFEYLIGFGYFLELRLRIMMVADIRIILPG